jgi:hypothetical protein
MTSETPGPDAPPDGVPNTTEKLKAYVDANAGRFTDAAITAELTRAGYAPDAIRAALVDAASRGIVAPQTGRAVRTILAAYGVTFAVLSLGMLVNAGRTSGTYMPDSAGGIAILGSSLGVALVASLIWVASRRAFALVIALILGISGISALASGGITGVGLLVGAIGIGWLVLNNSSPRSERTTATLSVLLVVPIIFLLLIGGICVASGLPIPRVG